MTKLPHDALVFICDGRKALLLRNVGDAQFLDLRKEQVFADENPPSHDQGTDRPGRAFAAAASTHRSSVAQTDWHDLEEHRFVKRVAAALAALVRSRNVPAVLVAAPPRALADLRRSLSAEVKAKIVAEIDKDLTRHPLGEIEKLLHR